VVTYGLRQDFITNKKEKSKTNVYKIMEELFIGKEIIYFTVITKFRNDQIKIALGGAGRTHGQRRKIYITSWLENMNERGRSEDQSADWRIILK
jgi:hypothetical protein